MEFVLTYPAFKVLYSRLTPPVQYTVLYVLNDGHVRDLHLISLNGEIEMHFGVYPLVLESEILTDYPDAIEVQSCLFGH